MCMLPSRNFATLLCMALSAGLLSCSSDGTQSTGTDPVVQTIERPASVSPELWQQLTAELERVLAASGRDRTASTAPVGPGSVIGNFNAYLDGLQQRAYFSYRNQGDYDVNGLVAISDLTPVGIHFGKTNESADWTEAQLADGDGNGVITIADVTPIGQNFGGRIDGYELQHDPGGGFVEHSVFTSEQLQQGVSPYPFMLEEIEFEQVARLRVVPFDDGPGGRAYGPPSNSDVVPLLLTQRTDYPQYRANELHTGQSNAKAPAGTQLLWHVPLGGESPAGGGVVSDDNGTVYFGTGEFDEDDQPVEGFAYCVSVQGEILWRIKTPAPIQAPAVVTQRGDVIFICTDGSIMNFASDGKLNWLTQTDYGFNLSTRPCCATISQLWLTHIRWNSPAQSSWPSTATAICYGNMRPATH